MFIKIQNTTLVSNKISKIIERGKSVSSGKYFFEIRYGKELLYFRFDEEEDYKRAIDNLNSVLKVVEI